MIEFINRLRDGTHFVLLRVLPTLFLNDQGLVMSRAPTIPSDLIVVSFMIVVIGECVER